MTNTDYRQFMAFTGQDGAYTGLIWIASFACFIIGMESPAVSILFMLLALFSPVFVGLRIRKYRFTVMDGEMSFIRAFSYSMMCFFNASILFAAALFVYFFVIDQGYVFVHLSEAYATPAMQGMLKQMGLTANQVLTLYNAFRPIDFALQSITQNLIFGLFLSVPIALLTKKWR